MKRISLGLLASTMFLSSLSWAQSTPQPPASFVAFQQQENAKRQAFNRQLAADQAAYFNANPEAKAYMQQMHQQQKARFEAWRAAHQKPNAPKI